MDLRRTYFSNVGYSPYLFYAIFGVNHGGLEISRSRHKVEKIPDGIDIISYSKPEHLEYIQSFFEGEFRNLLNVNIELCNASLDANDCVIIRGKVHEDSDFMYLRNVCGIIQALVEKGAVSILDLLSCKLIAPKNWTSEFFLKVFDIYSHTVIMLSRMENGNNWLHTRGMLKFGRPDISILNVPDDEMNLAHQVVNQLIFYGAHGAMLNKLVRVHTLNGATCIVPLSFFDDFDNFDFNNAYSETSWDECTIIPKV